MFISTPIFAAKVLSFSYIEDAMNILKKSKDLGWTK